MAEHKSQGKLLKRTAAKGLGLYFTSLPRDIRTLFLTRYIRIDPSFRNEHYPASMTLLLTLQAGFWKR